jgi:hypothetical protein
MNAKRMRANDLMFMKYGVEKAVGMEIQSLRTF